MSEPFDAQQFLKNVNTQPGVYQMFDVNDKILYVGKAKNLKNRLSSYFRSSGLSVKTQALVVKIANIQVTITESESAALVLEQNLIKALKPPYNILLRDDKSYPYILVTDQSYPRLTVHRGAKNRKGDYFGPYPSAGAVYQSINFLQKTFRIRQCEDSVFNNRSRPCLQYQIKRCTAPCVDFISEEDYKRDIQSSSLFLQGKSDTLLQQLADEMEKAASELNFEKAALLRDQIAALRRVQSESIIENESSNIDIFAIYKKAHHCCIHLVFVRSGRIIGSKSHFHEDKLGESAENFLLAFMEQYYLASKVREMPHEIIVNVAISTMGKALLSEALVDKAKRNIPITHNVKTQRYKWLQLATQAAEQNILQHLGTKANLLQRFQTLADTLDMEEIPRRLECFDISHSSGELTVASCVVFNQQGPLKSDYRRFNIDGVKPGDDYAAMEQALSRRYTRLQKGEAEFPDLLVVDGGKGQLGKAKSVLAELGVHQVSLLGIAKGTTRKAGFETLVLENGLEIVLNSDSPALLLLQELRDEAHRFAITGHKQRRDKKRKTSSLEGIPGVGSKRRRDLLRHFGGLQEVAKASVEDLSKVPGISKKIAENVYSVLRNE